MSRYSDDMERRRWIRRIDEWRADWNKFVRECLGANLDKEQQAILDSVQHNHRTSVVSGTSRGKDFVAACASLCFLYLTPRWNRRSELVENTKVAMTAPTDRQVKNIMAPEVARLYARAKQRGIQLPGRLNLTDIRMDGNKEWFLTGFKADEHNHEAWSGFHAVHTMFVVTEATGISDDTFEAIEGNLQNDSRILLVFNPNTTVGYAARSQRGDRWEKFRLNSLTAPNVVQHKVIFHGQVDYEWIQDKLANWCLRIQPEEAIAEQDDFEFEGQWYRPDDTFRKKVLGKFPKVSEDVLIPPQWLELAHKRWVDGRGGEPVQSLREPRLLGVDVAGMGRDSTCYVERVGCFVKSFEAINSGGQADHMKIAGQIHYRRQVHPRMYVSIDTIGEGAGVYSRCLETASRQEEQYIISCKFSDGAHDEFGHDLSDVTEQMKFLNMRAYLFWRVRDWLNPKNNTGAMLPPDARFDEEAEEIRWKFRSDGRIQIEAKEDIKERLGRSPDKFDALANTFYPVENRRPIDIRRIARNAY